MFNIGFDQINTMIQSPPVLESISAIQSSSSYYSSSLAAQTFLMDGNQNVRVLQWNIKKIVTLFHQIMVLQKSILPQYAAYQMGVRLIPMSAWALFCFLPADKVQKGAKEIVSFLGPLGDGVILTAYVAMTFWGFPVSGTIGLIGILLSIAQRQGILPIFLADSIKELGQIFDILVCLSEPGHFLIRVLGVASAVFYLMAKAGISPENLSHWECFNPLPLPVVDKTRQIQTSAKWERWCKSNDYFSKTGRFHCLANTQLNQASIYTRDWTGIAVEDEEEVEKKSITECFSEFENQLALLGIDVKDAEKYPGINKMRSYCSGWALQAELPFGSRKKFDQLLKMLFLHIAHSSDAKSKVEDLEAAGNQCPEGWIRDLTELLEPKSKNPAWHVHNWLAEFRGALILDALKETNEEVLEEIKKLDRKNPGVFDVFTGGFNNVHLANRVELGLRPFFRSSRGEIIWKQESPVSIFFSMVLKNCKKIPTFLTGLFQSYLPKTVEGKEKIEAAAFVSVAAGMATMIENLSSIGVPRPIVMGLYQSILFKVSSRYDHKSVCESLYEASKMKKIAWRDLAPIFFKIEEKGIPCLDEEGNYLEKFVTLSDEIEEFGGADGAAATTVEAKPKYPHLTPLGAALILFHLNVLETEYPIWF